MANVRRVCARYTSTLYEATEPRMREILSIAKALSDESRLRALIAVGSPMSLTTVP